MSDYYNITQEKINKYNLNWPKLLGHPERILIIEDSSTGTTNALLNLITKWWCL